MNVDGLFNMNNDEMPEVDEAKFSKVVCKIMEIFDQNSVSATEGLMVAEHILIVSLDLLSKEMGVKPNDPNLKQTLINVLGNTVGQKVVALPQKKEVSLASNTKSGVRGWIGMQGGLLENN